MTHPLQPLRAALGSLALLGALSASATEVDPPAGHFTLSAGIDVSTGAFDLPIDTDVLFAPFSLAYARGPWLGRVTVPFLAVRGPGDPQFLPGRGFGVQEESDHGIGDVTLDLSYLFVPAPLWAPIIELGVQVKVPTASRSQNLGTGELDAKLWVELSHGLDAITAYARGGYRFLGDNADFDLDDGFATNVGVEIALHERVSIGASHDWRQSTNALQSDPQEVSPYLSVKLGSRTTLTAYGVFGLTSSALDQGVGLTASVRF